MESEPEILLAEIPCISCGYNLNTLPVAGRCPECGAAIAFSLREALVAQKRNGWEVATLVRAGGWLNVILLVGALASGVVLILPSDRSGACCVFPGLTIYAIFQTVALQEAVTWPVKWTPRHRVIGFSGICFAFSPVLMVVMGLVTYGLGFSSVVVWAVGSLIFPAISVFTWAAGDQYAALCVTSELESLRQWCRRIGRFNSMAAALVTIGYLWRLMATISLPSPPVGSAITTIIAAVLVFGGLALLLLGAAITTVVQFVLAWRLRHLAKKAKMITLTGPALPTPPSLPS